MNATTQTTNRRLWWVMGVGCLLAAVIAVGLLVRVHQVRVQAQEHREQGLQAVEAGDHERAIGLLGSYLNHDEDDVEALFRFAQARRAVPQSERQHLGAAATALERVLRLDPDHVDAARELADLYMTGGRYEEAIEAANRVLEQEPEDAYALGVKAMALRQLDRLDEAIAAATRAAEAHPEQLDWHLMILALHGEAEQPNAALRYAQNWHARHSGDPRALLVLAAAHQSAGRDREALERLEQAAANPVHDETFVRELTDRFDALGEHERATEILQHAGQERPTAGMVRLYARRLGQLNQPEAMLAYLEEHAPDDAAEDVELTAIETLARLEQDQADRAAARIRALSTANDVLAEAWGGLLALVAEPDRYDPVLVAERASEVLNYTPSNPEALMLLGQAYAAMDEPYAAISAWSSAAERSPAWADPLIHAADVARAHPYAGNATALAREARRRAPDRIEAVSAVVLALADRTQVSAQDDARLLAMVDEIQSSHPFEPRTLPLYIALLHGEGQADQASALVEELLDATNATLDEPTWLRLARVVRSRDADVAERLLDRSETAHGPTPALALARGLHHGQLADESEGLAAFDRVREAAGAEATEAAWELARVQYLEAVGAPGAAEAWMKLADRHSDDLAVQTATARAPSVHTNRPLRRRAVDRMEELTDQRGFAWRVERARWLADEADASHARLVEALQLANSVIDRVPDHIEARLIAASSLGRLDNLETALEHLRAAQQRRPQDPAVNLQLAVLLQNQGDFPGARPHLERFATQAALRAQQHDRLASIANPGDTRTVEAAFADRVAPALLTARAHWQQGDVAQAREHVERLLDAADAEAADADADAASPLPVPTLTLAAGFFAAEGDWAWAEAVAARLDEHEHLPAGSVKLLLADLHRHYTSLEEAAQRYQQLTETAPDNRFAWRERIGLALAQGQVDDALELAREAQEQSSADETWEAVRQADRVLRVLEIEPELRPLGAAIAREPEHRDLARGVLEMIVTAHAQPQERARLVPRLRSLATGHPRFLALQLTAARVAHMAGDQEAAVTLARRAMHQFPGADEPAELAWQVLQTGDDWETQISVARDWQRLDPRHRLRTETMIAATYVRTNRPQRAIEQLQPRLDALQSDPEAHFDVLATYAHALVAAGRTDEAAALMSPWLSESSQWRQAWRWMAGLVVTDAQTAADWLEQLALHLPEDRFSERLDLIQQWRLLAHRFDEPGYADVADERLEALAQHADAPAVVHLQHGQAAEAADRTEQAEASYRQALDQQADYVLAAHHLARLLAREQRSLDEALALARQVAEAQPSVGDHLDVLAFVAATAGHHDEALQAIERLREQEADQPLWQLTHAWVLVEAGDYEQARQIFAPIADQLPILQPLPSDMNDRLARVHEALPELAETADSSAPAIQ